MNTDLKQHPKKHGTFIEDLNKEDLLPKKVIGFKNKGRATKSFGLCLIG